MNEKRIQTVTLPDGAKLSGYAGEYVFERINHDNQYYEQTLLDRWMTPDAGYNVIYDIGANLGNHTVYFARRYPNAVIHSFEPLPENYALLQQNISDNQLDRVTSYNLALGEAAGKAVMAVTQEGNQGTAEVLDSDVQGIEIPMAALDALGLPLPDFVKIDVEGYEVHVLHGMENILANTNAPVWVEVNEENGAEVYRLMARVGYHPQDFVLTSSNNILFSKNPALRMGDDLLFQHLLGESAGRRESWIQLGKEVSRFKYEQGKAEDLTQQLGAMTSKFTYEQKQLALRNEDINELREELRDEKKKLAKSESNLHDTQTQLRETQRHLNMYLTSRAMRFTRFWAWKVLGGIRKWVKGAINRFARRLYRLLLPFPRIRRFFSRLNGRLRIIKDPKTVTAPAGAARLHSAAGKGTPKAPRDFNVAMLVDEFTYNSYKYECNALPLEPSDWRRVFENNDIDFFFCESAWSGVDSQKRPWKGKVYASVNFPRENRTVLLEILDHCKRNGIPTVFWNKEDPAHYEDRVHDFVKTALLFDHIFTTDAECVERYKKDYGHKSVHLLMFATQPRLFNPIEKFDRTEEIIFAGSWYAQHPQRCEEMGRILDTIIAGDYPLKIYDRQSGNSDPNHKFPARFLPYVHPALPHDQLEQAYKGSKYALNINTVMESETMFARRVFELMSSNTLVISNHSKGMEKLFGDNVVFTDGTEPLDLLGADEKRAACLDEVLRYHTYANRFLQVLDVVGYSFFDGKPKIAFTYWVQSYEEAEWAAQAFAQHTYRNKEMLVLVARNCQDLNKIMTKLNAGNRQVISLGYWDRYSAVSPPKADYIILEDKNRPSSFEDHAMLHRYLDPAMAYTVGGELYQVTETQQTENVLLPISYFKSLVDTVARGGKETVQAYIVAQEGAYVE